MATTKAAFRRQCNAIFQSVGSRTSSDQWNVASIAILSSAVAAGAIGTNNGGDTDHCPRDIGAIDSILSTQTGLRSSATAAAQCEALLPYQRRSKKPSNVRANTSSSSAFGPWQSVTSSASRKSLLRRQSKLIDGREKKIDMHQKYNIDFSSVLGEGVRYCVHMICSV